MVVSENLGDVLCSDHLIKIKIFSFILLRYSGILATLPSLFFSAVQSQHCQAAVITSQVGAVLVVASSGIIFCYRIFAIWNSNKLVQGLVTFMFLVMMACWVSCAVVLCYTPLLKSIRQIAVATQYDAITGSSTPFGTNCQMQPVVSWAPISYASSVAFDSVVLGLTLAKLRPNITMAKSAVGRQIFRDTLMYFILTAATNIAVLSIQSLDSSHSMIKPTAIPFSTLMTVTMGSRVYLNLKLLDHRRQREQMGIPLTMPLSSSSQESTMKFAKVPFRGSPRNDHFETPYPSPGLISNASPYPSPSPYVTTYPTGQSFYEIENGNSSNPQKESF